MQELRKEWVANRARQEALTRKQRFEAGEFSIDLVRAADDPPVGDPVFQEELSRCSASLRAAGVPFSQTGIAFDSLDALGHPLPEFIVAIKELGVPVIIALTGGRVGASPLWM
jgi:predicted TIM-barrel fold metal-dependent hydrolase